MSNVFLNSYQASPVWRNWVNFVAGIIKNDSDKDEYIKNELASVKDELRTSFLGQKWYILACPDLAVESPKQRCFMYLFDKYRAGKLNEVVYSNGALHQDVSNKLNECETFLFSYLKLSYLKKEMAASEVDETYLYNELSRYFKAEFRGIGRDNKTDSLKLYLIPDIMNRSKGGMRSFFAIAFATYCSEFRTSKMQAGFHTFSSWYKYLSSFFPDKKLFSANYTPRKFKESELGSLSYLGNVEFGL